MNVERNDRALNCSFLNHGRFPGQAADSGAKHAHANQRLWLIVLLCLGCIVTPTTAGYAQGQNDSSAEPVAEDEAENKVAEKPEAPTIRQERLRRLDMEAEVWFDPEEKFVVLGGEVCLRRGQLEVFACPRGTKEHESIVKLFSPAFLVHTALLRVGAIPGTPVSFHPEYQAATGVVIDIWVYWENEEGEQEVVPAQEWVRNSQTEDQLKHDWVFCGSGFWTDETTGQRYYQADAGELICVSNFSTATMDLPIESTQANDGLLFEPFTERVPNRGTKIKLVLKPRLSDEEEGLTPVQ